MIKQILAFSFFIALSSTAFSQSEADLVKSTVLKDDIEAHIYFLASDELKGRQTGSDELKIAAAYIANTLKRFDVKPAGDKGTFYQNVPLEKTSAPSLISIKINELQSNRHLAIKAMNADLKGDAIYLGHGSQEDFENNDVKDKIVIVRAGDSDDQTLRQKFMSGRKKRTIAMKAGVAALIELADIDDGTYQRYSHYFNEDKTGLKSSENEKGFIHIYMDDKEDKIAAAIEKSKKLKTEVKVEGIKKVEMNSRNVVGYIEGSDPKLKDEYIIYSAHYDHVGVGKPNAENDSIYNGARDNAVGTVTVLSVAENLSKHPVKRSSLFILFTGEEKGLLGSQYYAENPVMPLDKMVYCFNSDGAGYNDTSKITIFGLNRTTVGQHMIDAGKEFGLTVIDDPAPEQNLFDRSDNVNFAAKGIPAPTFSLGFTAFDDEINKYYHQVTDNPETLDYDYLLKFFRSYVMSARLIADDPKTPFWTKGDKYYEAGVELYKEKPETEEKVLD